MPGALPLNTPRPFRLSDFCQQKSRHGRSSDDDLLMPGALPLKSGGLKPCCFGTNIHRMFSEALATPRPFRLSDFCQQKSRHGRSSDDDLLMPEALPLKSGGGIPPERYFSWRNGIKTNTYPPKPVFSWTKAFRPRDLSLTYIELKEKIEEYELFIYI